jgi:hypothetical protein
MNSGFSKPHSPEISPIEMEIAKYILGNPDSVFEEYQKLLKKLKTHPNFTERQVSGIYRREVADTKSPQYISNLSSIPWLVNNYKDIIKSPAELTTIVESLSGLSSADLSDESSEEAEKEFGENPVKQLRKNTKARAKSQLQTGTRVPSDADNDASLWIAEHS